MSFLLSRAPFVAALCTIGAPVVAQHVVMAQYEKALVPVRKVDGTRPQVEVDGRLVDVPATRLALTKVAEYKPLFVSVRNLRVESAHLEQIDGGRELNHTFRFRADFESPYRIDDVFLVLDLHSEQDGRSLLIHEVGSLRARKPVHMSVAVPLAHSLSAGKMKLHVFAGGGEVFHSAMPDGHMQQALDEIVARRIKGETDVMPQPFVGPSPEYPPHLLKSNTRGKTVLAFKVSSRGRVLDPQIKETTDPAFGESAIAAARQWRFLPRVKNGQPVDSQVDMPFDFVPPTATAR